jgi:hypothetical protein
MSLAELFTEYNAVFTATTDEIAAWNAIDPLQVEAAAEGLRLRSGSLSALAVTEDNAVVTKVGLFGADLTDFNADCVLLEDDCDIADYENYNGWGVGVNFESEEEVGEQFDGVGFATSKWCVVMAWEAETNMIESAISDVAIAEDAPGADDVEFEAATDAFGAWAADAGDNTGAQFVFSFFEADDTDFYFEAGDTEDVWALGGVENVKTTAFEFVGAASLTAATSVIVAALLF